MARSATIHTTLLLMHYDDNAHLTPVDEARIFALVRPDNNLMKLYFIYALLSNVAILFTFFPLYFRFKTLRYRFDNDGVAVSYGLLFRRETYLTYARIQDIHVSRNIFERWLGIGSVDIQTAAGSSDAEEAIVGIKEFNDVRNFLYARMRGHGRSTAGSTETPASSETGGDGTEVNGLLCEIRDELAAARRAVEGRNNV